MEKFTIITNSVKDKNQSVAQRIADYRKNRQKKLNSEAEEKLENQPCHYTDVSRIPEDVQCVIVLGGDGTLLQAARDVVDREILLFGINLGTLGYLAEIEQHNIYPALDRLMSDRFTIERRMMLSGEILRNGEKIASDVALNDIVISREGALGVVQF